MSTTPPHPVRFADDHELVIRLRSLCRRYPEAIEVRAHGRATWRAGSRQFALAGAAHQDEEAVVVRADQDERSALLERDDVWIPAYDGAWGYVAIAAHPGADWELIAELVDASYRLVANKRQLTALDAHPLVPLDRDA
jgi:hypothetical protein